MLKGNLSTRGNLRGELTGGIFYGTMDYTELINKPSINSVELNGNKTLEDLGINIPTATSELDNDSGFITSADVPTSTSELVNDSGFITSSDVAAVAISGNYNDLTNKPTIPTATSQLTNDSGFITSSDIPTNVSAFVNDRGYLTSADVAGVALTGSYNDLTDTPTIPTKTSDLDNDSGFITSSDIPTDVSAFTNDAGYISNSDLMTATASGSIATFDNGGDDIPVSEFECEIVAQQASGTPTPSSPLPITGFSQADISVCGKNLAFDYIDNCNIDASGTLVWNTSYKMYIAKVEQGKTYSTNLDSLVGGYFDTIPVLNDTSFDGTRVVTTSTFIATHTGFIAFRANSTDTQVSLKEGVDPTYAPYTGNLYTVSFGQTIYGGRLIYANGQWSIEATHGYHEITGTENWVWAKSGTYTGGFYTPVSSVSAKANIPFICTHAQTVLNISDYVWGTCFCDGSFNFRIMQASDTIEDWKTYLANQYANGTPVSICFELATPVIIPITSTTRVKTISGDNNIYSNTGDCELKYFTNKADSLAELIKAF